MSKRNQPHPVLKFATSQPSSIAKDAPTHNLPLESIVKPAQQPRRYFDPEKQKQLELSIEKHGILEPLLVRPLPDDNLYELVAGERRFRAAQTLKLIEVPVVIKELSHDEALQIALIENLQRLDLNPIEETEGILQLLSLQLNQDIESIISLLNRMQNEAKGKVTQNVLGKNEAEQIKAVFESLGIIQWQSFVTTRLPLLKLPEEVLEAIRKGEIAYTKATLIARLKDKRERRELLAEAIEQGLSLAEIKRRIQEITQVISPPNLKKRMQSVTKKLYASKCWDDPKKQKKLEKLVSEIESLL